MSYTDSWIREEARLSAQTCPNCGALNCTGICIIGDLKADLERYEPMLAEVDCYIHDMGLTHGEAMEAVFKDRNPCMFDYESFCQCVQELRESIAKIEAAEKEKR